MKVGTGTPLLRQWFIHFPMCGATKAVIYVDLFVVSEIFGFFSETYVGVSPISLILYSRSLWSMWLSHICREEW